MNEYLAFQFHYGTIKRDFSKTFASLSEPFQFHYGTIKRVVSPSPCIQSTYFNSTMVRLKAAQVAAGDAGSVFQFHYGTIKRLTTTISETRLTIFQFHYGTIKRSLASSCLMMSCNFNSTMVRLKD